MTHDEHGPPVGEESAVSTLPLRRSIPNEGNGRSTLRLIPDVDQVRDHSGKPVEPVTATGLPYRYKVRLPGGANAYTLTADEVLALFIEEYDPDPPAGPDSRAAELEQVRRRGRHCLGLIVDHVAGAMLDRELTEEEERQLQRSADLGYSVPPTPITRADCPVWANETVPMMLLGDLYDRAYGRFEPPAGNVVFLTPGRAERYLQDLVRLGLIVLAENPAYTARPPVEVRSA